MVLTLDLSQWDDGDDAEVTVGDIDLEDHVAIRPLETGKARVWRSLSPGESHGFFMFFHGFSMVFQVFDIVDLLTGPFQAVDSCLTHCG